MSPPVLVGGLGLGLCGRVVSRYFTAPVTAARTDELPLPHALVLARAAAREGTHAKLCAAACAALSVAEHQANGAPALALAAARAVVAMLARALGNLGKKHGSSAARGSALEESRAELGTLRAQARRLAARLASKAAALDSPAPRCCCKGKAPSATSLHELRARCATLERTRSARHVCEALCYLREFEPARKRRALVDAMLVAAGSGQRAARQWGGAEAEAEAGMAATMAAAVPADTEVAAAALRMEAWRWRAELAMRPQPRSSRCGCSTLEWSVALVCPGTGQRYKSVPEVLRAAGLGIARIQPGWVQTRAKTSVKTSAKIPRVNAKAGRYETPAKTSAYFAQAAKTPAKTSPQTPAKTYPQNPAKTYPQTPAKTSADQAAYATPLFRTPGLPPGLSGPGLPGSLPDSSLPDPLPDSLPDFRAPSRTPELPRRSEAPHRLHFADREEPQRSIYSPVARAVRERYAPPSPYGLLEVRPFSYFLFTIRGT
ncbi:hypothetical protein T492DRAFT_255197 [Pavlovales sp. CCMP2436]|nr:hypothetical protein T492DRAFT_255197 [Pavlovales sp. CCMP2436]